MLKGWTKDVVETGLLSLFAQLQLVVLDVSIASDSQYTAHVPQ
jgi:hypothetical protein